MSGVTTAVRAGQPAQPGQLIVYECESCAAKVVVETPSSADKPNGFYIELRKITGEKYRHHSKTPAEVFYCSKLCLINGITYGIGHIVESTIPIGIEQEMLPYVDRDERLRWGRGGRRPVQTQLTVYSCRRCNKRAVAEGPFVADMPNGFYLDLLKVTGSSYRRHDKTPETVCFCTKECLLEGLQYSISHIVEPVVPAGLAPEKNPRKDSPWRSE